MKKRIEPKFEKSNRQQQLAKALKRCDDFLKDLDPQYSGGFKPEFVWIDGKIISGEQYGRSPIDDALLDTTKYQKTNSKIAETVDLIKESICRAALDSEILGVQETLDRIDTLADLKKMDEPKGI